MAPLLGLLGTVYGMISSLLAAGVWLLIATTYGWPVSTTHTIVGAIVGFAAVGISVEAINWGKVMQIVLSWVISPLLAGVLAFVLYMSVKRFILNTPNPIRSAKRGVPVYIFLVGFVISMVSLVKGLKHIGLNVGFEEALVYAAAIALMLTMAGSVLVSRINSQARSVHEEIVNVERVFGVLMLFTACSMAFAHGSNDVANAIGPLAAINSVISSGGEVAQKAMMPNWLLLLGAGGIALGLMTYGYRVIRTIGSNITELTPSSGFAAELAAATTVVIASGASIPVSTTHTLVGGVLGVGLAHGLAALNLRMVGTIFTSWIVTLPAGALLSILFFYILKAIFGVG